MSCPTCASKMRIIINFEYPPAPDHYCHVIPDELSAAFVCDSDSCITQDPIYILDLFGIDAIEGWLTDNYTGVVWVS